MVWRREFGENVCHDSNTLSCLPIDTRNAPIICYSCCSRVAYHPNSFLPTTASPTMSTETVNGRAYFRRGVCVAEGPKGVQHAPA